MTCDKHINHELGLRLTRQSVVGRCLPEVLVQMLRYAGRENFEILFYGVNEGQYDCMLFDMDSLDTVNLRRVALGGCRHTSLYRHCPLQEAEHAPVERRSHKHSHAGQHRL